jgi:hypothetical protein
LEHVSFGLSYTHVGLHDVDMDYRDADSGGAISLAENTNACLASDSLTCSNVPYPVGAYLSAVTVVQSNTEIAAGGNGYGVNIGAFNCPIINWIGVVETTVDNAVEHNIRTEGSWRTFYGHNDIRGHHHRDPPTEGVRAKLTIRSCGSGEIDPQVVTHRHDADQSTPDAPMTRYAVVADNLFGSTDDFGFGVKLSLAPTNTDSAEVISYGVVERNRFIEPDDASIATNDVFLGGYALACRTDNTYSTPGVRQDCTLRDQGAIPSEWFGLSDPLSPVPPQPAAPAR